MRSIRWGLAAGMALLVLGACSGMEVRRDFDPTADFGRYRTFKIQPGAITGGYAQVNEQLVHDRVSNALRAQLKSRGLAEDPENPDVLVTYVAGARDQQELESAGPPVYAGYGWYDPWYVGGPQDFYTRTYTEGTLVVDMVDAKTKRPVWRGYAATEIDEDELGGPSGEKRVQNAVKKLFDDYPPKSGSQPAPES